MLHSMNLLEELNETLRLIRNLIRIGTVTDVDLDAGKCRVLTGENTTDWLQWLSARAGATRTWFAPSVGEQVLIFSLGGELNAAFVLPGIFSDNFPAPSASAEALHFAFSDGAVIEYEPKTGALKAIGITSANIEASESITAAAKLVTVTASQKILLDSPTVECTQELVTKTLKVTGGGEMRGDINHSGGTLASNGVKVDNHSHGGVMRGGDRTEATYG